MHWWLMMVCLGARRWKGIYDVFFFFLSMQRLNNKNNHSQRRLSEKVKAFFFFFLLAEVISQSWIFYIRGWMTCCTTIPNPPPHTHTHTHTHTNTNTHTCPHTGWRWAVSKDGHTHKMACCYPHTHMQSLAGWAMRVHPTHTHTHTHTHSMQPEWTVLVWRAEGWGWEVTSVQVCLSNYLPLLPLQSTHTHTHTHTQAHTETHHPDLNSLLISPYRTIKVPPCSGTWSPTVGKRGRQVQEEKFDILFVFSLSLFLSLSLLSAHVLYFFFLSFEVRWQPVRAHPHVSLVLFGMRAAAIWLWKYEIREEPGDTAMGGKGWRRVERKRWHWEGRGLNTLMGSCAEEQRRQVPGKEKKNVQEAEERGGGEQVGWEKKLLNKQRK